MERIAAKDDPQGCKVSLNEKLEILSSLGRIGKKYKFMIMEKELNIAAILKDKQKYTKLYSPLYGEVFLNRIVSTDGIRVLCKNIDGLFGTDEKSFWKNGKFTLAGDVCLFPSKGMQDWSKFAWKKGDVLTDEERFVVFKGFNTDDYTEFSAPFEYEDDAYRQGLWFVTNDFRKVSDNIAQEVIKKIENHYGGKLNLSTLEIEQPKQEFNDGDILVMDETKYNFYVKCIFIIRKNISYIDENTHYYVFLNLHYGDLSFNNILYDDRTPRPATDSEKQQLFSELEKEGKAWDAEKKAIVDLPKKCEFEAFDKVLFKNWVSREWTLGQYSHSRNNLVILVGGIVLDCNPMIKGGNLTKVLPYNDSTKHLLGTTDEWKGGEG